MPNEKSTKKVLVIDDEEYLVKLLKSRLMINRFVVVTAADGEEGLVVAERERPDLIVLDVLLPVMNGADFVKALRNNPELKHTPVLAISAQSDSEELFKEKDICAFVQKPFQPDDFISQVKRALHPEKKF